MMWAASKQLPSFSLRVLSGFLWAVAEARHYDRGFFDAAAVAVKGLLPPPVESGGRFIKVAAAGGGGSGRGVPHSRPSPHDLSCVALAFAQFNHCDR